MSAPVQPNVPRHLIAIGGLSGTGKSTLARALVTRLSNAALLRSDVVRKALFGVSPTTRLGQHGYTAEVTARVYRRIADDAAAALADGRPVLVDAVFARPSERDAIEDTARQAGAAFIGLWLDAPREVQVRRVDARRDDASDATAEIVLRQAAFDVGAIAWVRIDAAGGPDRTLAAACVALDRAGVVLG